MTMFRPAATRLLLFASLLIAAALARAQEPIVGAQVFLFSPGPVSSTLLAAPSSPNYLWDSSIWYWGNPRDPFSNSITGLSTQGNAIGQTVTSSARIPSQDGLPLVFVTSFTNLSDIPPGPGQPGDIPHTFSTTGFVQGNNAPSASALNTVEMNAAVLFGAGNTAQIGFAPAGMSIGSFEDYPIRIRVTNVIGAGGGC
jgi:hypothetical protein